MAKPSWVYIPFRVFCYKQWRINLGRQRLCIQCGGLLHGKQEKYCSNKCRMRFVRQQTRTEDNYSHNNNLSEDVTELELQLLAALKRKLPFWDDMLFEEQQQIFTLALEEATK